MSRHLRPVPNIADEPVFVVGRSRYVRPGAPYVIALCVDRVVAAVFALAGQQVRTRADMERDPTMTEALRAWDAGDQSLFHGERKARVAIERTGGRNQIREVRWHPSRAQRANP